MANFTVTMSREFKRDLENLPLSIVPKAVDTAFRLAENPWVGGLHSEKVQKAEPGVYSCRVDRSYRIIWKHIKPNDIVICLVDSHDEAYRRAACKSFTLEDGIVKVADVLEVGAKPPEQRGGLLGLWRRKGDAVGVLFAGYTDRELLDMGVPEDVLPNIRALDDVNQMDQIERLLPEEVYDRLLGIALGIVERQVVPDQALRRSLERHQGGEDLYRFVDSEEFKRALKGEMEEWMLFLAPHQRQLVTRQYNGPARVKGVAGSGKTVVAVHRARHLAREAVKNGGRVLFLTFGSRLPGVNEYLLQRLAGSGAPELDAIECRTVHSWCARFLREQGLPPHVDASALAPALEQAIAQVKPRYPGLAIWSHDTNFFKDEICYVIKGRAVSSLEDYLALERGGRGTPLRESAREAIWEVYQVYQAALQARGLCDWDDFIVEALRLLEASDLKTPYVCAVVDEIQDLTEATMRLIRRIVPEGPNDLFLVGDGLQRIYPGGYVLGNLGIDITGRGTLLRRNYRNTQEILRAAHAVVAGQHFDDMDEEESEAPEPEYSVRRGEVPLLRRFATVREELQWARQKILQLKEGHAYQDRDFALLYRYRRPYQDRIRECLGGDFHLVELGRDAQSYFGPGLKHITFDSAKGLEFKVVFVVGVTDGQFVPRDDWSLKDEELEDYMARERRRLYVAMTRARDLLYLTYSRGQPSRFLNQVPAEFLRRE